MHNRSKSIFIVVAMLASAAFASPPHHNDSARSWSGAKSASDAEARSNSRADSESRSNARSGDSQAAAASGDVNSSTEVSSQYNEVRQVPIMVQGIVTANDCGSGANGGAANTSGAGFLGFTWTTSRCYALKTGSAFAAAGDYEMACNLWVAANRRTLRRAGIYTVDCRERAAALRAREVQTPEPAAQPVADAGRDYVTRTELQEHEDRIVRSVLSK